MNSQLLLQIAAIVVPSAFAIIGTLTAARIGRDGARDKAKIKDLEKTVGDYRADIRARQAEEDVASRILVTYGFADTPLAALRKLRSETEKETGLRPFVKPGEVKER